MSPEEPLPAWVEDIVPAVENQPVRRVYEPGVDLSRSSARLKTMALSGGFAVDEDTGNRMIRALEATLDSLESRWAELTKLRHTPPMSESPTARWAARHMVDTATDADGLLTQLIAARREIPAYVEAIRLAKRAYREQGETSGREFREVMRLDSSGKE